MSGSVLIVETMSRTNRAHAHDELVACGNEVPPGRRSTAEFLGTCIHTYESASGYPKYLQVVRDQRRRHWPSLIPIPTLRALFLKDKIIHDAIIVRFQKSFRVTKDKRRSNVAAASCVVARLHSHPVSLGGGDAG